MITVKIEKSVMENEEGINHVWIQFQQLPGTEHIGGVRVSLELPEGMHRLPNMNGYPENEFGAIEMGSPIKGSDVLIELYTEKAVPGDKGEISVIVDYRNDRGQLQRHTHSTTINFANEDGMNDLLIDEEVAGRVKQLRSRSLDDEWEFTIIKPAAVSLSRELSELEKKYRIEY
jgi:ATP-dependent Clp protease protease subunit